MWKWLVWKPEKQERKELFSTGSATRSAEYWYDPQFNMKKSMLLRSLTKFEQLLTKK